MYDYFSLQAKIGITKHIGGLRATRFLIGKCGIGKGSYVLVIGSGNGDSAMRIVKISGCRILGIDISPEMVGRAREKKIPGAEFRIGDAEKLDVGAGTFDAVISESVTAFTDKRRALKEYHRVLKKGGRLGLNEVTWLEEPSDPVKKYAAEVIGGLRTLTKEGWVFLLKDAGFDMMESEARPMRKLEQLIQEIQMQGLSMFLIWPRFFWYYFAEKEFRKSVHRMARDALLMPKGFMKVFGYGLYVARK